MANNANLYGAGETSDDAARRAMTGEKRVDNARAAPTPMSKRVKAYWCEIERYKRATSTWTEEGRIIENLYLDQDRTENSSTRRFALLWANVETLKPAVYAKLPNVQCSRRYRDRDPIARVAAELMERAVNTSFELYGVDETFQMVRDDRLLPGRGQAWVRYEATIERDEGETNTGDQPVDLDKTAGEEDEDVSEDPENMPVPPVERLKSERVCVDYVHWADFGHNVASTWNDVWLVWRCVYKTKDEVAERFGDEVAQKANYNAKAPAMMVDRANMTNGTGPHDDNSDFCRIYELWDKRKRRVTWLSEGFQSEAMDEGEPPVDFSAFFPCPRPCYATKTSRSLIPRPDYIYYRDQAKEINDLTDKIGNMMDWLIVKAFVPAAPSRVTDAIEEAVRENSNRELFVQVESFTEWTEKGGAGKLIDWLPLDMIIKAIQAAIQSREQLIQDVFQITGISDILRGQTDPTETLGAQELKAQTGSRRLKNTKDDVARLCQDVGRLCAEVVAEKFEPETIAELTGYKYEPAPVAGIGHNGGPALDAVPLPLVAAMSGAPMQAPGMVGGNADAVVDPQGSPGAALASAPPAGLPPSPAGGMPVPGAPAAAMPPAAPGPVQDVQDEGPDMTFGDDVMELLRNDRLRSFRINIETDSTGQADEAAEQSRASEFVTNVGGFMEKAVGVMTTAPELAPVMSEMLEFVARRFRAGRSIEETIEKSFAALQKKASAAINAPAQQSPEQIKAQADAAAQKQKMAEAAQKHEQDMQNAQQKAANDQQIADARLTEINAQTEAARELHAMHMAELAEEQEVARLNGINAANEAARRSAEQAARAEPLNQDGRI